MLNSLPDLLGLPADSRPLELARAVEQTEIMLRYQARRGSEEAARAMLNLRLAYLRWAYSPGHGQRETSVDGIKRNG